jgi:hypothetical protein
MVLGAVVGCNKPSHCGGGGDDDEEGEEEEEQDEESELSLRRKTNVLAGTDDTYLFCL